MPVTKAMQNGSTSTGSDKNDPSSFPLDSDSDLSDAPPVKAAKPRARKSEGAVALAGKKATAANGAGKAVARKKPGAPEEEPRKKKKSGKEDGNTKKKDAAGKSANGKTKQTSTAGVKTPDKAKATPKKPAPKPVDPPTFEKVDTRLSQVEGEERMGVSVRPWIIGSSVASRVPRPLQVGLVNTRAQPAATGRF